MSYPIICSLKWQCHSGLKTDARFSSIHSISLHSFWEKTATKKQVEEKRLAEARGSGAGSTSNKNVNNSSKGKPIRLYIYYSWYTAVIAGGQLDDSWGSTGLQSSGCLRTAPDMQLSVSKDSWGQRCCCCNRIVHKLILIQSRRYPV